ncbi:MAG TPA: molybdate ABC transporter substrate-binding protein [Gaiellaceae bacterium]|nr:molybdate ABC transporter substrate-binding protein [Gaiellaceae bacterium]
MSRRVLVSSALVVAALAAGAGWAATRASTPRLTVFAAASLTDVLPKIDPHERYSFGGSNALAAQIQQGIPADVLVSANTSLPRQLYAQGLVAKPVVVTANTLVMIVPHGNPGRLHGIQDVTKPGLKVVVGAAGVPVGDYTRTVLAALHLSSVVAHAASQETDVREVLAKVALGEADAGFVYATDARTVAGKVAVFPIPASAQPRVEYAGAAVASSPHRAAAQAFLRRLLAPAAQRKLRAAGFLALPRR